MSIINKVIVAGFLLSAFHLVGADDFITLREQWVGVDFPSCQVSDNQVRRTLQHLRSDGTFDNVDYADQDKGRWDLRKHWDQLLVLARGFRYAPSYKGTPEVRDAVIRGIRHWTAKQYVNRNWWYQSIGIPLTASAVFLYMGEAIPPEVVTDFRPVLDRSKIGMTAQNRLHLATIHFLKGIIYRDPAMVGEGRAVILEELRMAPLGQEGVQADFSFHQHGPQMQFGNYGLGFLTTGSLWSGVMRGTAFSVPLEKRRLLTDFFLNGTCWVLFKDVMDFSACGRQIVGRAQIEKFQSARKAVCSQLDFPDAETEKKIRNFFQDGALAGNRYFWRSDFMVQRSPELYFSVKMCSQRVRGTESNNTENQLGRNTASGFTQFLRDGHEYYQVMPLWNWRRLPGVTALEDRESLHSPDGFHVNRSALVGGVSDGRNGATMFELDTGRLNARKSYFAFDGYFVNLGSAIRSLQPFPINTTLESRWLRGEVRQLGDRFIHDGFEYRMLTPGTLRQENVEKEADWTAMQPSFKEKGVKGRVWTLWIDHGTAPSDARYGYCVAATPGLSDRFELLGLTDTLHAGRDSRSGLVFISFFAPGAVELPGIGRLEALQSAAVMIRDGVLTAADPLQKETALRFRLNGKEISIAAPQGAGAGQSSSKRVVAGL